VLEGGELRLDHLAIAAWSASPGLKPGVGPGRGYCAAAVPLPWPAGGQNQDQDREDAPEHVNPRHRLWRPA